MSEEWCREQLENLKVKENRLQTLALIRDRLTETTSLETKVTERLLSSSEIYDCLDDCTANGGGGADAQLDIVSDILSICMANLTLRHSNFPQVLRRALLNRRPKIRSLALNTILKELENEISDAGAQIVSEELLRHIISALGHNETEVGVPAIRILTLVLDEHLEKKWVRDELVQMLKQNETIKCRLYELAVYLAKRSPAILRKVEFLLDHALSELDNDDVLLQANILEILVLLAERNHGISWMERRQIFDVISKRVETLEQNPLDRLIVPGIMKFFGKIAAVQPQKIITGYPHMILCLFDCLHSADTSILPTALDTLANLTRTTQGILLLEEHYSAALKDIFRDLVSYLRNLSSDLKNRVFSCLDIMFTHDEAANNEVSTILQHWFLYMALSNDMQFLMDFCRNPFPDIKVSCLSFIRALCLHSWGIVALKNTAGFVEYLLDRKIEFDKEAKYAKYELIKLLSESSAFDVQTSTQLRTYVNEGPYYVESVMDIAVEGN